MFYAAHRAVRAAIGVSAIAVAVASGPSIQAQRAAGPALSRPSPPGWRPTTSWPQPGRRRRSPRLVFDTSVTPRWLDTSDRFWYSYNTREGRRFMLVDPVKKTKAPLFDHAKMAAALTMITRHSLRRAAPAVHPGAVHQERRGLRVRSPGPARSGDPDDEAEADHHRPAGRRAAVSEQTNEFDMDRGSACSRGSRSSSNSSGQGGQRGAGCRPAAAAPPPRTKTLHFEYDMATGKVVARRGLPRGAAPPDLGARCRPTARRSCSRATTTSS